MSDFFSNLVARARSDEPAFRPNLASYFESSGAAQIQKATHPVGAEIEAAPPERPKEEKNLSEPQPKATDSIIEKKSAERPGSEKRERDILDSEEETKRKLPDSTNANKVAPISRAEPRPQPAPETMPLKPEPPSVAGEAALEPQPQPTRTSANVFAMTDLESGELNREFQGGRTPFEEVQAPTLPLSAPEEPEQQPSARTKSKTEIISNAQAKNSPAVRVRRAPRLDVSVRANDPRADANDGEPRTEPVVHVTIGRLEIRAAAPLAQTVSERPTAPTPRLSLDEYLRRSNGGAR